MSNWIFIVIAVIFLIIPVIYGIFNLIKAATSNKITLIQGDKQITISSKLSKEDREKLVNF